MNDLKNKCPSPRELQDLLEGSAPDSEQAAIVSHLDNCSGCQESIEALADSDGGLAKTLSEQPSLKTPDATSAYWPALHAAEIAATRAAPKSRSTTEISLAFLDPPTDGTHLGSLVNFAITRVVGRGGMGVVMQARDNCLERDVAIKVLDPELAKDEVARKRFCREARAAASISHENVVAVHQVDIEEAKDLPYLVMELITGESLEHKLVREGKLSLKEIVRIGMQTAAGLSAAHDKGLIHRDIKPGNILLEQTGQRVKLTDFGLARAAEDLRLTSTGLVAGTPLYMSPEQASGDELDARSDLFSLGVVLYELAAGEPPFMGKTPLAVLNRLTEEQHEPLRQRNPDLPEWFTLVVDRLLAKKPEDRFQSAREVSDLLEHFWTMIRSTSETLPSVCPKKKAQQLWRTVALGVGAGLVTLLAGVAALFFLFPRGASESKMPTPAHTFEGNAGPLWSMVLSRDGKKLAMGTDGGFVKFWDIAGNRLDWSLDAHKGAAVWAVALSPDRLATAGDDAKIWDMSTRKELHSLHIPGGTRALAFDPTGKKLLVAGRKGNVKLFDVETGTELLSTAGHSTLVGVVAFAPDGKSMATASADKTIKIWDAVTGQEKLSLTGHQAGIYGLAFSPSGRYLASGSWDRTVRLWDLDSGTPLTTLQGHTQDVWSVDFDPTGKLFASAGEDQMVRIWSVETKKEVASFRGSTGSILNVRFSPTGLLAIAGKDGTVNIWNLSTLNITP